MSVPFRTTVHGIMLCTGMCFIVFPGTTTLQTFYYCQPHQRSQIRVFSISFHTTSPTRITINVDIRSPKSQPFVTIPLAFALKVVILGTGFIRDDIKSFINSLIIESSGKPYCLWKNRCLAGACHSMQRFIPPVVCRYSEAFNSRRTVFHLAYFFFQGHTFQ